MNAVPITDKPSVSSKARMKYLLGKLELSGKQLALQTIQIEGKSEPVIKLSIGMLRKLCNPNTAKGRWKHDEYDERICQWLRDQYNMAAPDDMFWTPLDNLEKFWNYCAKAPAVDKYKMTKYATNAENQIAYQVDCWIAGLERLGLDYFRVDSRTGIIAAKPQIDALTLWLKEAQGIPAPELVRLADSFFETCGSCGQGAEELETVRPFLEALWDQRVTYATKFDEPEDAVSQALLFSKLEHDRRFRKRAEEASSAAAFVTRLIKEHAQNSSNRKALKIALRVQESLDPDNVFRKSLTNRVEGEYGPDSIEFFDTLKCEVCRASLLPSSNFKELHEDLTTRLNLLKGQAKTPEMLEKLREREGSLNFIALTSIWMNASSKRACDDRLRQYGIEKIQMSLEMISQPLRRARLLFWLYCADYRKDIGLLQEVIHHLNLRPSVRVLCVVDVDLFKSEVMAELKRLQDYMR